MDIFSIGCVIAEMFMDGKAPLFDLAKLLKYRSGGSSSRRSLRAALEKFNVPGISKMVQSMLHHNVDSRLSASAYLKTYTQSAEDTRDYCGFVKNRVAKWMLLVLRGTRFLAPAWAERSSKGCLFENHENWK